MSKIRNQEDVERDLQQLLQLDTRLTSIAQAVPQVPLRLRPAGFAGLAHIVIAQLVSVASAKAISARLNDLLPDLSSDHYLAMSEQKVRDCGLSNAKYQTLYTVANAQVAGEFDFAALEGLSAKEAQKVLCQFKGVGPWTAEVYLLFCAGHADIFPAGDLALRKATAVALQLSDRPSVTQLTEIAQQWSPYRGTAARLLWAYYAVLAQREGLV